ncbi:MULTISPECIES: TRAP transporter small permease [Testudinibacter]|uniref:TRAP transporter small permease protein n=1 Tax=Testudinibacter aquarius TaxID=1524974 RepID=A0A4R3Y970_9PAST|nr:MULTISPECIES: TRAP transporter small permease [Testudinibacter]TNH08586.1 TRAP transporter small permease [Pasteurellaceae bacterium Phil11]KAE9526345.1 C4-dicarboxylate ABC transporter permease [Testudinibacter aquarius]TCV87164.1 TRAP-type C4-dicarboxylate transport system permease small subunit [Testudinibacter aquarius]TNG92469.1 TRAP transporter small permease [Testudinibacter aquarius]TNH22133.1 TRAP transporter small permease [Testudinibacter sp. TR-2022]
MNNVIFYTSKILETIVVLLLSAMAIMVFTNVVLRYSFHTSITVAEELSRYAFVWVTFLGAVLVFKENGHVSVSVLIDKLSPFKRKLLTVLTDGVMLYCCYLIFVGSYAQMQLNMSNYAPISEIPTGVNFLAGVIMSGLIGLLLLIRLVSNAIQLAKGELA